MPIAYHDLEDINALGTAAFLQVVEGPSESNEWFGALLVLNARGEPLEFAYNRIALISNLFWRPADRVRAALRRLCATLFDAITHTPSFLLCRADRVDPHVFGAGGQIELSVPVGRVATGEEAVGYVGAEQQAKISTVSADAALEAHLFWTPGPPEGTGAQLFAHLAERGLIFEPFDRAAKGLREVYPELREREGAGQGHLTPERGGAGQAHLTPDRGGAGQGRFTGEEAVG